MIKFLATWTGYREGKSKTYTLLARFNLFTFGIDKFEIFIPTLMFLRRNLIIFLLHEIEFVYYRFFAEQKGNWILWTKTKLNSLIKMEKNWIFTSAAAIYQGVKNVSYTTIVKIYVWKFDGGWNCRYLICVFFSKDLARGCSKWKIKTWMMCI